MVLGFTIALLLALTLLDIIILALLVLDLLVLATTVHTNLVHTSPDQTSLVQIHVHTIFHSLPYPNSFHHHHHHHYVVSVPNWDQVVLMSVQPMTTLIRTAAGEVGLGVLLLLVLQLGLVSPLPLHPN